MEIAIICLIPIAILGIVGFAFLVIWIAENWV